MASDYHNTLKKRFIGNREFYREVAIIVIPMIIQNTVTNIVSMLDNLMVGAIGTVPMAAVSIINYMLFVFNLCVFGGLSGPGIFATQYAGAHDDDGIRHCFRFKFITMMLMTAAATAILLIFEKPLIGCFLKGEGSPEEIAQTFETSRQYLQIMLFGLLPFAFAMMYSSALRELGETRIPMIASVTAILVNLVFNYLLIFGKFGFPRMEAAGAAIATVLSRVVEMAIIVIYTHVKHAKYRFIEGAYRSMFIPRKLFMDICVRGTPLLFNEMCWSFGMTFLIQCYSLRGIQVIAACNIAMTFANIFNCAFFSMGAAVAVIIGHELGSNKLDTVMETAWKLVALTVFINKSKQGKAMRAVSEDRDAAQLMGINVNRTITLTFAIGSALAAVAGILLCSSYPTLTPYTGAMPGIKAFTAAVFGGIGSIPGAMLGGVLIGIIQMLANGYISTQLSDAIVFAVLIIVLLVKPTGLLGKKINEKV